MVAMMVPFEDLEVVAVQAFRPEPMRWRALPPVFRRRGASNDVLWPLAIRGDGVVGHETRRSVLESAIQEASVTELEAPFPAAAYHRVVATETGWVYAHRDDIYSWRSEELCSRLCFALGTLSSACGLEDVQDAFDAAFLVDRWSLVAAALRAGVASLRRDQDPDWFEMALEDLDRCEEFCASLDSVLSHPLTTRLPDAHRQNLFREASYALSEWRGSHSSSWQVPVAEQRQMEAAAFAIFHAEQPETTRCLSHGVLRDALQGDPGALDVVKSELGPILPGPVHELGWEGLLGHGDFARLHAVATAAVVDRRRFAQNLYRLELGAGEKDRRGAWRNFLRRSRPFSSFREMPAWRQGEELAVAMRQELAITAGIPSMRSLVDAEVGVFVGVLPFPADRSVAAASVPRASPPCIFANESARPNGRRRFLNRFSIAHELAHLVLDRDTGGCDWSCVLALDEESKSSRSHEESRANAFASYFLAPRDEVVLNIPRPDGDARSDSFVKRAMELRRIFGLSVVAAGEHLANCYDDLRPNPHRALPPDVRARLRAAAQVEPVTGFEADEVLDPEMNGSPTTYSSRYALLVARNRRASHLDDETARRLLGESVEATSA